MQLSTPVAITPPGFTLGLDTHLLTLGSCFADEMGCRMQHDGFDILCNPFGTLYNPLSIAEDLRLALDGKPLGPEDLVLHDGLWHSWMHHSRFSSPDRDECLARCNQAILATHDRLLCNPTLIVTFGTAWVFRHEGRVVANCHKIPPRNFTRTRLTIDEIVEVWTPLLSHLSSLGSRLVITVSPIRHMADGAHGNQLSKATLLLSTERLISQPSSPESQPSISYFPSYEILLDELRDYRFYARDLCHPSDLAADLVYERFLEAYTTTATRQQCLVNRKQARQEAHRPIIQ